MKLIAATYAPLREDCSLHTDILPQYGGYLKHNGIHGVFVNGSTGDFVSLSTEERKVLVEAWAKERRNGLYVINQVGHTSLREACELAAHSQGFADAVSAVAPYYFRIGTMDKLVEYCKKVAAAAPGLPFYYYHIPVLSGADFKMAGFLERAGEEIPNFAGIKFTHNDLTDMQQCMLSAKDRDNEEIFFGIDEMFVSSLVFGAKGWVGSTYNHLSPLYREIWNAFHQGAYEKASGLQAKAVKFVELLDSTIGYAGAGKGFMKYFDLNLGPSRFPHNTLSDAQLRSVLEQLKEDPVLVRFFGHIPSSSAFDI